jgi:hypothetical protein
MCEGVRMLWIALVVFAQPAQPATPAPAVNPPEPAPVPAVRAPAVPWPHPIITEVLYAVPPGTAGDANKDGKREVTGDEFVELVNPHDKPIQLFGYTLTDSQEPGKGQMKFTFPAVELAPGGVVVVFNGLNSTWSGPVGDSKGPPTGPHEQFGGSLVFTMRNTSNKVALGNQGDQVLLSAPDNTPVQRVYWTEEGPAKEEPAPVPGAAPTVPATPPKPKPLIDDFAPILQKTSVHRDSVYASGRFVSHMDSEHAPYSPGVYVIVRPPAPKPVVQPEQKP